MTTPELRNLLDTLIECARIRGWEADDGRSIAVENAGRAEDAAKAALLSHIESLRAERDALRDKAQYIVDLDAEYAVNGCDGNMDRWIVGMANLRNALLSVAPRSGRGGDIGKLIASGCEFLTAMEHLCDWANGNDLVADYAEAFPVEFKRQCVAMGAFRAALKENCDE
jgi:hypothetical protein